MYFILQVTNSFNVLCVRKFLNFIVYVCFVQCNEYERIHVVIRLKTTIFYTFDNLKVYVEMS